MKYKRKDYYNMVDASTVTTTKSWDFKADTATTYTLDTLNTELQKNLGVTITAEQFDAINGTNSTVSDTELSALEGGNGDNKLTLNEFTKDTDAAVKATLTPETDGATEEWNFDTNTGDEMDTYSFEELVETLEIKFKATVDEASLKTALMLSGWTEGEEITDAMIRNLEGGSDNGILTITELNADTDIAVKPVTKKVIPPANTEQKWNYGTDKNIDGTFKTSYTKVEFNKALRDLGLIVNPNSDAYKQLFLNNTNASDAEIKLYFDKAVNGKKDNMITKTEAASLASPKNTKTFDYADDAPDTYKNNWALAKSIFTSLGYSSSGKLQEDPRFLEIYNNVKTVLTGTGSITDTQILNSALDSNEDGIIDTWVTDNNPLTTKDNPTGKKPVVATTTSTAK